MGQFMSMSLLHFIYVTINLCQSGFGPGYRSVRSISANIVVYEVWMFDFVTIKQLRQLKQTSNFKMRALTCIHNK